MNTLIRKWPGLLRKRPPAHWGGVRQTLYWLWNCLWLLAGALYIGVLSLWFAALVEQEALFASYLENPVILLCNMLPVVALAFLLYFVTRRVALAYGLTALVVGGLTMASWFKYQFRSDPLYFAELFYVREAGNMLGRYQLFLTQEMTEALLTLVGGLLLLALLARGRPRVPSGVAAGVVTLLLCVPLGSFLANEARYETDTRNDALINRWSETEVFLSKGFVYPFLYSVKEVVHTAPAGYDAGEAAELLASYEDAGIPQGQQVSVISVMLEAFNDFTRFEGLADAIGLDRQVYAGYHALEAEGLAGTLVTNIFAGGTVNSERCYLTGFADLGSFRTPTNSYPWYFRSQGYAATGAHPCYSWFYNRENINRNLGLTDYKFVENYFGEFTGGDVGLDNVFFPQLITLWEEAKGTGLPLFSYNLSYQGHGPYNTDQTWWGDWYVDAYDLPQEQRNILNNYFGSVYDTIGYMEELVDYFRQEEAPVVLVFYGDHNPWMGDANSVYEALGVNFDLGTQEGFFNYYGTRYLIWANDAAKAALGREFVGEGPMVSSNFLMNVVFDACGWTGPAFLQAAGEVMAQVPVINTPTGLYVENGQLTDTLSEEGAALVERFAGLCYYYQKYFAYQELANP